jgi:hypothetical protein
VLGFDFDKSSAEFRYRLDGEPWKLSDRDRLEWLGAEGWYRTFVVAEDLTGGNHTFEMEVIHGNYQGDLDYNQGLRFSGTNMNLGLIGILP